MKLFVMENIIKRVLLSAFFVLVVSLAGEAKEYSIAVSTDPDGAEVYLNGMLVSHATPAIIQVEKKIATKTMIFTFRKEGYESKSVTVAYSKKQLGLNPVVYGMLKKKEPEVQQQLPQTVSDPTVGVAESFQRVNRDNAGATSMEATIIRWFFDSDPRGARVFYRVISSVPAEVKNTNEAYMGSTPFEETRGFNIPGLTYNNSRDVTIEIKVSKRGYEDQVKRFNVRQALDQQEISGFFELVKKDTPADSEQ
ncbi:PEGA domain-containing protein [uncultured Muribaculum sp.]|uniref:PEGA domain-containing protein n=2 Tax=uncultured Muribaculum sp. TaxID=1918613 RepID=UPI0025B182E3|nr:PEGA domain-containing protein [uncultured Muribaculum sp.]